MSTSTNDFAELLLDLHRLQKAYFGEVEVIYIDPPYNTGREFVYPDNFKEGLADYLKYSGQVDESSLAHGYPATRSADLRCLAVPLAGGLLGHAEDQAISPQLRPLARASVTASASSPWAAATSPRERRCGARPYSIYRRIGYAAVAEMRYRFDSALIRR